MTVRPRRRGPNAPSYDPAQLRLARSPCATACRRCCPGLADGERFDLRLPYVDQGWVEGGDAAEDDAESVDFFANLLSGGKLQREADERRRNQGKSKGKSKGNK